MFTRWLNIYHGGQSVRDCPEAHLRRQQPIQPRIDVCFNNHHGGVFFYEDKLLKKGPKLLSGKNVRGLFFHTPPPSQQKRTCRFTPLYYLIFPTATLIAS